MSYQVWLMPQAQKDLEGFRGKFHERIKNIILGLYEDPRPHNSKKLVGRGSQWRIRAGDYRILYELDEQKRTVRVYRILNRKEAYR